MKVIKFILCFALLLPLSSCYFNNRLVYLQDKSYSELTPTLVKSKKPVYRLQSSDVLSVQVKSSTETEASNTIFNVATREGAMFTSPGSLFLEGYTVDIAGKINLPIIGEVLVKDLTVEEVQKVIQEHANKYLNKSTVIVKLTSFKVTVLGEVKNPGYLYVFNNQVNVLETLGLAGDLTQFANRKNVKLIRQVPEGSQVILLDLTDPRLLSSEYFYLLPNDVLYVEPLKARSKKANLEVLGVVFAGLTTLVLVLSYVE
jgi:polysaccharide export outer membrane protein